MWNPVAALAMKQAMKKILKNRKGKYLSFLTSVPLISCCSRYTLRQYASLNLFISSKSIENHNIEMVNNIHSLMLQYHVTSKNDKI